VFKRIESRVAFHPSSLLVYLIDGASLNLKKPWRFAPMTLRPLRFADYIGPNGRIMTIGDKKPWTKLTRTIGKTAVAEGKRQGPRIGRRFATSCQLVSSS
jgi:hypothetical protein